MISILGSDLFTFLIKMKKPELTWEVTIDDVGLENLKKQGYDLDPVFAVREKYYKDLAAYREATKPNVDFKKLDAYAMVPRDLGTPFVKSTVGSGPWLFGKTAWKERIANAPLVYAAIVQANSDLWMPGDEDMLPMVLVFSLNPQYVRNREWLTALAEKVYAIVDGEGTVAESAEAIRAIQEDQNYFCFPLGSDVTGEENAQAWCATFMVESRKKLPNTRLPEEKILPFLLEATPKKGYTPKLRLIASEWYAG